MDKYALAFSISNIGSKKFQKILASFDSLEKAWYGSKDEFSNINIAHKTFDTFDSFRKKFKVEEYILRLKKEDIYFISFLDKNYPSSLKSLENPPIGLFAKGNLRLLTEKLKVGVVGTRKITSYGRHVTESISSELVAVGVTIVSGLALGVDGIAHKTAVSNGGKTIAVLACGVDCCRPAENFRLYKDILNNNGLILSEYPLSLSPKKGTFLARNRIIAALSDGVLVTEASEDSGSLITAEWAFKLGKKVFAVPGPITSRMSDGSLKLLKKGARLVTEGKDILNEFEINKKLKIENEKEKYKKLSSDERTIVELLKNEEMTVDELSKKSKLSIARLFAVISGLEIKGIIKNISGKVSIIN